MLTVAAWGDVPSLRHGFLDGAESETPARDRLAGAPVVVARQVHGTRIVRAVPAIEPPEADALVTVAPGPLAGVVTADCVPVLLVDRRRCAAAAVHAGWRGASAGILEAAVAQLAAGGSSPDDLEAAVGPAIGGCCYEVGVEVREAFEARTGDVTRAAWLPRSPRPHLDLRAAAASLLAAAGVARVSVLGPCTACDRAYRSYRRDGAGCGRQLSFVGWA